MKVYAVDEAHETEAQRSRRLVETYARRGWGIDDIQTALKRQHAISIGRNAVRAIVWAVAEKRI